MPSAIKIEDVSKLYRLGQVGTGTISHDLNRWWHHIRGKEDPYAKIGQTNDRSARTSARISSVPDYVWALRGINLDIEQGDIVGIIGRNGAGKSTLLKLLSRVTAPSTGTIKAKGRIASLLEVGTGFHPELTGRENIYLNGAILGMKRKEISTRLDEIVEFSGCAKYLDTPTKRYSSGMTVRLGFAVAAHLDCEILIVDEVLAVGDSEFQKKCIGKMRDVARGAGKTVLFVSHNMSSIEQLCTRGVLIGNGGLQLDRGVDDVVGAYLAANDSPESSNLVGRADEFPGRPAVITHVECSQQNEPVVAVQMGMDWNIQIRLHVRRQILRPQIAIAIDTDRGVRASRVRSVESAHQFGDFSPGEVSIHCIIRSVNLVPGCYRLAIGINEAGTDTIELVPNALRIEVVGSGVLGGTTLPDHASALCYFQADWSARDDAKESLSRDVL